MRPCIALLATLAAFVATGLQTSAGRPPADRAGAADKTAVFCLAREEKCWVAYGYSLTSDAWTPFRSPECLAPRRAVRWAEGAPGIVILDADKNCAGLFFDADTLQWKSVPEAPSGNAPQEAGRFVEFVDRKLVVWGLRQGPPHGAELDLRTLSWRPMPDAPVQVGYRCRHAASATKVFFLGRLFGCGFQASRTWEPDSDGCALRRVKELLERDP